MAQRIRKESAIIDVALREYFAGAETVWKTSIEKALDQTDPLTRELVENRARGHDWRQITRKFCISAGAYYRRLQMFRQSLILIITNANL